MSARHGPGMHAPLPCPPLSLAPSLTDRRRPACLHGTSMSRNHRRPHSHPDDASSRFPAQEARSVRNEATRHNTEEESFRVQPAPPIHAAVHASPPERREEKTASATFPRRPTRDAIFRHPPSMPPLPMPPQRATRMVAGPDEREKMCRSPHATGSRRRGISDTAATPARPPDVRCEMTDHPTRRSRAPSW